MLYQILSLATRKDVLGEAIDAMDIAINLPSLIERHGAIIIEQHPNDYDDWVKTKKGELLFYDAVPDTDINKGGYYVEVFNDIDNNYKVDDFCVHPNDCDCTNEEALHAYIRKYIYDNC